MAKSERPAGKRGETHYNRKEGAGGGKSFGKSGSAGGGRSERPARRDEERPSRKSADSSERKPFRKDGEGDRKPFRSSEGDRERKPYRKAEGDRPFKPRREDGGEERKPFRKDGERKPYRAEGQRKPFKRDEERSHFRKADGDKPFERKSFGNKREEGGREERPYRKPSGDRQEGGSERPYRKSGDGDSRGERKPYTRRSDEGDKKPFARRDDGDRKPYSRREESGDRKPYSRREEGGDKKPFARKREEGGPDEGKSASGRSDKSAYKHRDDARGGERKPYDRKGGGGDRPFAKKPTKFDGHEFDEASNPAKPGKWDTDAKAGPMTLNKYLAHAGVSSRREAAIMIKEGKVTVNGAVLAEPGYRVKPGDKIAMDGKEMKPQSHFVYVLLNKPKDFITTTEDDRGRRTVMELVSGATEDRLYPVGRLDRNTTGVLLLTNDGDLAQKLSHPKYESKKIYQVTLDKDVTKRHFDEILEGVKLEDGIAKVDRLAYLETKNEIGLEIHSGRNRIVRRIFESLGYDVVKLDRVMYAGLTKKNVSRGKWRFLSEKEVIQLKHFRT